MHEISLARTIFRTLEEQFNGSELSRLNLIELKIGPLANVEPLLLEQAFQAVVQEEAVQYRNTTLKINLVPILIQCLFCGSITEVRQYKFVCTCGLPCANVVQGNELLIERVAFDD